MGKRGHSEEAILQVLRRRNQASRWSRSVADHDGVAVREGVFLAQPLEDPLGRVPLLRRRAARKTVQKMLRYAVPPGYQRQQAVKRPTLGPWAGVIDAIPNSCATAG